MVPPLVAQPGLGMVSPSLLILSIFAVSLHHMSSHKSLQLNLHFQNLSLPRCPCITSLLQEALELP